MLKLLQNLIKKKSISRATISGRFNSDSVHNYLKKIKKAVKNLKLKLFCLKAIQNDFLE